MGGNFPWLLRFQEQSLRGWRRPPFRASPPIMVAISNFLLITQEVMFYFSVFLYGMGWGILLLVFTHPFTCYPL